MIDDFGQIRRLGDVRFDRTAILAAQLQVRRLLGRQCDLRIGINSVALQLPRDDDDKHMLISEERERNALPNPAPSRELMLAIASYARAIWPAASVRD